MCVKGGLAQALVGGALATAPVECAGNRGPVDRYFWNSVDVAVRASPTLTVRPPPFCGSVAIVWPNEPNTATFGVRSSELPAENSLRFGDSKVGSADADELQDRLSDNDTPTRLVTCLATPVPANHTPGEKYPVLP